MVIAVATQTNATQAVQSTSGIIQSKRLAPKRFNQSPQSTSLVVRLLMTLRLTTRRPLIPTLMFPRFILHRYRACCSRCAIHLTLHIRPKLDVLIEIANVAADDVVGFEAEGYDREEAECEEFPALVDACAEVAAVLALGGNVFAAFKER
jgi:hypothetical protein